MNNEEIDQLAQAIRMQFMPPRSVSTLIPKEIAAMLRAFTGGHAWTYQSVIPIGSMGINVNTTIRIDGQIELSLSEFNGYKFWSVVLGEYEET